MFFLKKVFFVSFSFLSVRPSPGLLFVQQMDIEDMAYIQLAVFGLHKCHIGDREALGSAPSAGTRETANGHCTYTQLYSSSII
jgi:hypothetical protein